jgi:hypothetical protein
MTDAFATDSNNKPLNYKAARRGPDALLWRNEESKELVRLLEDTKTMKLFDCTLKPLNRKASYYNPQIQCKVKDGVIVRRIRGTYGGNISDFTGNCSSYTADLQTVKIHYNAIVSEGAKMLTLDLTDFYLGSTLPHPKYMWLTSVQIPPDIQERYKTTFNWSGDRELVQYMAFNKSANWPKTTLFHYLSLGDTASAKIRRYCFAINIGISALS